ncbi:MAG: hypothetical protein AAFR83_26825, partial [Cyanobacteria bacterium J06629_18]
RNLVRCQAKFNSMAYLETMDGAPVCKDNLDEIVQKAWNSVDDKLIEKLYDGADKRLRRCISARGAPIGY